jgi:aminopeptidase N
MRIAAARCAFILLLVLCISALAFAQEPIAVSYRLNVVIDPPSGHIAVRGQVDLPPQAREAQSITFALHETLAVKRLSVNGHEAKFTYQPAEPSFLYPARRNVAVSLPPDAKQGSIRMEMEYEGQLKELPEFNAYFDGRPAMDDQINARLVELACYSSWYPQVVAFGRPIKIEMEVSLPKGWTAIASGKKVSEAVSGGGAITRWESPRDFDIVIAASPDYQRKNVRLPDAEVEVYFTKLPEKFVTDEATQIADVMKLFTDRLGATTIPGGKARHVFSPKRKGQGRAGIARAGLIVTSEGLVSEALQKQPDYSLFQDIAHEIAHFWWNFGSGQGDWINEAFAEYFSAVAVEKVNSEEQFAGTLERYRKTVATLPADAPPITKASFEGPGFVIRYYKGSLMLDALRREMGDAAFFKASREFFETYRGKGIGAAEFRGFWKQKMGERGTLVDQWLDSPGGLPEKK